MGSMTDTLNLKVVTRSSVKKTPMLYFYTGSKYLGCLFFSDETSAYEFKLQLEAGGNVEFVDGLPQQEMKS